MLKSDARIADMLTRAAGALARMDAQAQSAIGRIAAALIESVAAGGRVLVCGNGGSAADAQHIAGEFVGRFRRKGRRPLPCIALSTDTSTMTAIGNDLGFRHIFSRQVEALGRPGDVLWALSTSGVSTNVVDAVHAAKGRGMKVVAMTGQAGGPVAKAADVCFQAPADSSYEIQQLHQVAYHIICELVDERFSADA
jgi:D-sedoheptulose 7-phosphate isomerase